MVSHRIVLLPWRILCGPSVHCSLPQSLSVTDLFTVSVCTCMCSVVAKSLRPHGQSLRPQALLSMEISRQEYWSELPFPSPGALPDPGVKPASLIYPALAGTFFPTSAICGFYLFQNVVLLESYIQCVAFSDLLLSLSNTQLRVLYVFS